MSRSATVPTSEIHPQPPKKSAWARGPLQSSTASTSSSSQSPASPITVPVINPTDFPVTHSRRSKALGVSIKDGANLPRCALKQGSAMTFGSIDDASTLISSLPANDAAHRQIEEQELRKVEEQLKGEAEHTEIEWADAEEWKETEEWVTREVTGCMEADERTTWEEGGCKEADESAAREAHEAEERKKGHLRMEEEHAQREVEDKIQWEQEWGCKVREEAVRATDDAEATSTLAHAISDAKLDPPEEVGVEDGANKVQQTDTVEETSGKVASVSPPVPISTELPTKFLEEPFRIGASLPFPEVSRNHPGSRDLQTALTSSSATTFPSALAAARHIEDINSITYPEGIKSPEVELNVNAQKGKFRYDRDFLLQFMNICKEKPDNLPPFDMMGKHSGLRNFQPNVTRNSASASPSTLFTVRHIEDINRASYSESIKNSEAGFNVSTWKGRFSAGTASIVPIDSSLSNPNAKLPFTPNSWRARHTGPGTKPASFLGMGSGECKIPDGSCQQSENSFLQHGKYFFKDGNVTFLINGILYCVHRYLFSLESLYFSTRFTQLGARDHEALSVIVSLGDVECEEFEAFLSVLYPHLGEHGLSYKQWRSVLHLSTRWGFASRRKLALESIEPPTPYDRLLLARKYEVDHWVIPALTALCERTVPLSLDEARGMNLEDVVLVATIREDIFRFGVSAAEIPRRVEAMQAGVFVRTVGDVSLASSMRGVTEQGLGSTIDSGLEAQRRSATLTEPVNGKTMSSWDSTEPTTKSQGEQIEPSDGEKHWQNTKVASKDEWDVLSFEGEKGKTRADEDQYYRTTNVASNDKWATAKAEAAEETVAATAEAELKAKQKAEKKRLKIEAKSKAKAAKAEEERKRVEMEKAELCVKQAEEQNTREAASIAANTSVSRPMSPAWGGSNWFSKIAMPLAPSAIIPKEEPTHSATSFTAAPSSGSAVSSSTLVWQEGKLTNDKQDGKASENNHADLAPAEIVAGSWPSGDLDPASGLPPPSVMPRQPRSLPESQPLRTPRQVKPEQYAIVTPSPELAASAFARRETPNVADTKNPGEPPAQTKASPAAVQHCGVKPDEAVTEPTLWPSQPAEAGSWGSAITKGGDINPEGPMKVTPWLDDVREVSTAFAVPASGPGAPAGDGPSFSPREEDGSSASGAKLSRGQKKRIKNRARKLAQLVGQSVQNMEEDANPPQPTISPSTPPPTIVPVAAPIFGPPPHILSTPVSSDSHLLASNFSNVPDQSSFNELIASTEEACQAVSTSDSGVSQSPTGPLIGRVLRGAEIREVAEELGRRGEFVCRFVSRGVMCRAPPKYLRWTPEGRRLREAETYTLCCVEHGNSLPRDRKYVQIPQSLSIAHSR